MMKTLYHFTLMSCVVLVLASAIVQSACAEEGLWDALRDGGKVVLMRHAPVERGPESGNSLIRDSSCKKERNLSSQGKRNAEVMGGRFTEQNIPVYKVMHSPFCRTTDTARIAFGAAYPADYLSLLEVLSPEEAGLQTAKLNHVIGSYAGDSNLILITHEPNISAVSFELLKHLDMLVVDPNGEGEYEELGVLKFTDSN